MSWYALDEIEEAIKETKELLLPFDFWTWTKIAVIVFFIGGGFNLPTNFPTSSPGGEGTDYGGGTNFDSLNVPESSVQTQGFDSMMSSMSTELGISDAVIVSAFILILSLVLLLTYLSSVFEFIFYRSLIDKNVKIRKNFKENIWKGARYFGFKLLYTIAILGLVASVVFGFMVSTPVGLLALLLFIPLFLVLAIFSGITHDFVLLRMLEADEKLLEAWKSFWPELRSQWKQVGVYFVVKFFIGIIIGIASGVLIIILTILLALPVVLLILAVGIESMATVAILALAFIFWMVLTLYVSVPFTTYLYYYVILVYHDLTS